jgi:heme-degrading monooxygenase HmoA
MSGPVRLTLTMQPQPGCEAEFIAAWRLVAAATSRVPGNLRQTLVGAESTQLVITSDWASMAQMRQWEISDEQHELTAAIRELRQSVSARVEPILLHVDAL